MFMLSCCFNNSTSIMLPCPASFGTSWLKDRISKGNCRADQIYGPTFNNSMTFRRPFYGRHT